jgi:hypothetical protein
MLHELMASGFVHYFGISGRFPDANTLIHSMPSTLPAIRILLVTNLSR